MTYRLITGKERNDILDRNPPSDPMPSYGELIRDEASGLIILYFRNTLGQILVIDVTAAPPEHFYQHMPVPETFLSEVWKRLQSAGSIATQITLDLPTILWAAFAIIALLLVWPYVQRK